MARAPSEALATPSASVSIEIRDLRKVYDDRVVALNGVSLDIQQGEFFTLLGPSGSGKSTLLHSIGGFVDPTSGQISIGGEEMTGLPPQRRPVSTVFQEYALFPHLPVEENVRYGLDVRGVDADRKDDMVTEYLELLQIGNLRSRSTRQLSGGQRQRVALARSLIVEPEILLLDEPLGPLDEDLRQQMQFELKRIHEETGTTFVYVTHNQEEALTMSDRIYLLRRGNAVEVNTAEEIYSTPRSAFTATFLGSGNLIQGRITATDGETLGVESAVSGTVLHGLTRVEDLSVGDRVGICVRPDDVSLGERDENAVTGRIERWVYKGNVYEYLISLADGTELHATSSDLLSVETGEEVTVSWATKDAVIVEPEEELEG
jgi:ABC-type Fe3+/spermidine/putrescine transport system ATPase subunit